MGKAKFISGFLCLLICSFGPAWAQQATGTLSGRITSATGQPVPNAAVTVTNIDTAASQRILTTNDGSFTISGLAPGTYRVDVETAGFKRTTQNNVVLSTTSPGAVNIVLETGGTQGTVNVEGMTPVVQAESGEVSHSIQQRTIQELPVADRNVQQLMYLIPGVTPPYTNFTAQQDPLRNRLWEAHGQPSIANNRYLDGVENLEPFYGGAVHVPANESIKLLNTYTSNYPEEVGRAGGALNNVVSRPGTNGLHGSLFEFFGKSGLNARNYFNASPNPRPEGNFNQFGASLGGPIARDHTFFFLSYQGTLDREEKTLITTVPTAALRAGDFSAIPGVTLYNPFTGNPTTGFGRSQFFGNVIPANRINPVSQNILTSIPMPNRPGLVNNYIANTPFKNDSHIADGRVDHRFGDRSSMFLRYGYSHYYVVEPSVLGLALGGGGETSVISHSAQANFDHNFSAGTTTNLRLGYNRYSDRMASLNNRFLQTASGLGFSGVNDSVTGIPQISIAGLQSFGTPANLPMNGLDNTFNIANSWAARWGGNALKFGFDAFRIHSNGFQDLTFGPNSGYQFAAGPTLSPATFSNFGPLGTYPNALAAFLLGAPTVSGRQVANGARPRLREWVTSAWVGDTFQLYRVTLDIGLRYDVFGPVEAAHSGNTAVFNPNTNTLQLLGTKDFDRSGNFKWRTHDFGPRAGLAFRLTDRTVLRGGWGMSYWEPPLSFFAPAYVPLTSTFLSGVPGTFGVAGRFGTIPTGNPVFPANSVTAQAPNQPFVYVPPDAKTPYTQSYSAGIQQDLGSSTALNLTYVGNKGRHLPYSYDLNAATPGAGMVGMPLFLKFGRTASSIQRGTGLNSNYNALQVELNKRFSHGFSFAGAYTWSKSLDSGSSFDPLFNPFNMRANYGPSDWDRQHMLTISHLWQLPIGTGSNRLAHGFIGQILGNWQFNGVFRWATGTPLTITADQLACNCFGTTNFVTFTGPLGSRSGTQFFNASNFEVSPNGQFGNLGRNALRGPDFKNYDVSLFKNFAIMEQARLEIRGEAYNLFNTVHFANPVTNLNAPDFGQFTRTPFGLGAREIHLGLRLLF